MKVRCYVVFVHTIEPPAKNECFLGIMFVGLGAQPQIVSLCSTDQSPIEAVLVKLFKEDRTALISAE